MPIEELQEPIWEKQKGETPNQYCYFLEFLEFPTFSLKAFHDHLCQEYSKVLKSTDKTKIPKYQTIKNWASCNKWTERKTDKRKAEKEDIQNTLHEINKEDMVENFILKKAFNKKLLERLEASVEFEKFSQIKHGVDAYKGIHDDNLLDMEKPTNYTKTEGTLEVEADTKITNPGLDKIAEAFTNGRRQYRDESTS